MVSGFVLRVCERFKGLGFRDIMQLLSCVYLPLSLCFPVVPLRPEAPNHNKTLQPP